MDMSYHNSAWPQELVQSSGWDWNFRPTVTCSVSASHYMVMAEEASCLYQAVLACGKKRLNGFCFFQSVPPLAFNEPCCLSLTKALTPSLWLRAKSKSFKNQKYWCSQVFFLQFKGLHGSVGKAKYLEIGKCDEGNIFGNTGGVFLVLSCSMYFSNGNNLK